MAYDFERLLERAARVAEQADLFIVDSEETPVHFEANRLKSLQARQSSSVALRVIKEGRLGFAVSTRPDDGEKLLEMALETARFGQQVDFELPGPGAYPSIDVYDSAVLGVPTARMVELGERMISAVTGKHPDVLCDGGVETAAVSVRVMNSRGADAGYRKTVMGLGLQGTRVRGTDMLFVGDDRDDCRVIHDVDEVISNTLTQLERSGRNASVRSGELPVLFTPSGVVSAFIPALASALNGKLVFEGASPLSRRLGEVVLDENFSLYDDAAIPMRPTSRPCDDEGVPCRRTPLIENGRVANFYYDLKTAAKAGKTSTGNGSRGRGGAPAPSVNALVVASGQASFESLLSGIKEGLVVEYLMGAEQGNVLGGDFSGNVLLGYKVENGEIVGRVKDTVVAGNVYKLLSGITVGADARWQGGVFTPSIFCPAVPVAAK
ncbi:TldD/PmbA family protein [Dehalogenimonas alkenigignens]|uniref:Putative Zn-dependent protease n=1 Tax=Dehalogenimonas alkenigignens TaxID=1217799 RepID=A0A0W0GFU5_9CHLR|nr:TldD/PmbA family protein [Dehalogenimonas alkenigignens]KTB47434.1 putative Zn-dependent protease [Dehalogenimonas alkenigignens]PVV83503.1 TldD/PmbA family protein [Dehalogenimonas alkenigignens]